LVDNVLVSLVDLQHQIEAAFAKTPSPGTGFRDISATQQDEGIVDYFRGTTWRGHCVADLRHHSAALSFFTGPAFRYWLPAFMLASLEDPEAADVIPEHIASDMQKNERLILFAAHELRAIAAFLHHFAAEYDSQCFKSAEERVVSAVEANHPREITNRHD
jgi:hypothetical protein